MTTIAHLYEFYPDASATVTALEKAGIPYSDISIIASDTDTAGNHDPDVTPEAAAAGTGEAVGAIVGGGTGLLAGLGLLAIPGIGPVLAAGWLVAAVTGAGVGAAVGSLIGGLVGIGVENDHARVFAEGIRRGGALVTVRVEAAQWHAVQRIMVSHNPVDPIAQAVLFKESGWTP